jgi:xylose isomerase
MVPAGGNGSPPTKYSAAHRDALLTREFDRIALASKGLGYERLDQLTMEVLLGVR